MRRDEGHCDVDISSVSFAKHLALICLPRTHSTQHYTAEEQTIDCTASAYSICSNFQSTYLWNPIKRDGYKELFFTKRVSENDQQTTNKQSAVLPSGRINCYCDQSPVITTAVTGAHMSLLPPSTYNIPHMSNKVLTDVKKCSTLILRVHNTCPINLVHCKQYLGSTQRCL